MHTHESLAFTVTTGVNHGLTDIVVANKIVLIMKIYAAILPAQCDSALRFDQ